MSLTQQEKDLVGRIREARRFTVVRFGLRNSQEDSLRSTALNHVHIDSADASMEEAKATGALLQKLEEDGMVRICYNLPVSARSDFQVYYESGLFAQLVALAADAKGRPGFLFDTPWIKRGVVTVTARGRAAFFA